MDKYEPYVRRFQEENKGLDDTIPHTLVIDYIDDYKPKGSDETEYGYVVDKYDFERVQKILDKAGIEYNFEKHRKGFVIW